MPPDSRRDAASPSPSGSSPAESRAPLEPTAGEPDAAQIDEALRRLGHEAFRPGQREAVETLLRDGRLLLVAPTGGGKSLSYQLPALILPVPVLEKVELVAIGAAAAIFAVSDIATLISLAPLRVGWINHRSPFCTNTDVGAVMVRPSTGAEKVNGAPIAFQAPGGGGGEPGLTTVSSQNRPSCLRCKK